METLVAAAVFAPVAGAVTAYHAWGFYLAWRNRHLTPAERAAEAARHVPA